MKKSVIILLVTAAILTACSGTAEPQQGTLISADEISADEISANEISANESSSSGNEVSENIADAERVSEAVSEESTETESTEDAEGEENVSEDDGTHEYLDISLVSYGERLENVSYEYDLINLETTDYPLLTEAVNNFNVNLTEEMESKIASMQYLAADWREHLEEWDPNDIWYSRSEDIYIQRQDSMVLSVVKDCYEFSHGAHGAGWYESTNLNTQTGEEIPIDSVITDFTSLPIILEEELQEQYPHLEDVSMAEKIEKYIITDDSGYDYSLAWALEYDGVRFYFGHYEVGVGYGGGRQSVNLLYSEYPELFNSMYFEGVQDDFVIRLSPFRSCNIDLNEDGITEYITVSQDYESIIHLPDTIPTTLCS